MRANKIGSGQWWGTKNYGEFMIFELLIYDILQVLNFKHVADEGQLPPPPPHPPVILFHIHAFFVSNSLSVA